MRSRLKKVLLIHSDLLLLSGVESLLTHEDDLHLASADLNDRALLIDTIAQLQPNVIICDEYVRLKDQSVLCGLINECSELRLLIVSVKNNHILVYDKQAISITGSRDLITAIRGE